MPRIIAIANQKGGTGKTVTTINLGHGLARTGRKVLLVDVDPQGNLGVSFGVRSPKTLYHLLLDGVRPAECIVPVRENLDLLTSDETAARAEQIIFGETAREQILKRRMHEVQGYDYTLLDCPPSLSLLSQNALICATEVFTPISMEFLALVGVKKILKNLELIHEYLGHDLDISLAIPTFYDARQRKSREILESLRSFFKGRVGPSIRTNVKLSEAPSARQTIFEYAPTSYGAQDYRALTDEVIRYEQTA